MAFQALGQAAASLEDREEAGDGRTGSCGYIQALGLHLKHSGKAKGLP